jgi:hypothetical protein
MADRIDTVIEDGSLRRLARERSAAAAPVLIEVTGPSVDTDVVVARGAPIGARPGTTTVRAGVAERTPPDGAASAVREILGRTPRYLRAARSFAAVATGAELAALAASPAVAAIRPDRLLPKLARH